MCMVSTKDQNRVVLGLKVRCEAGIKHGTRILTISPFEVIGPHNDLVTLHYDLVEFYFKNG
jgi:hypothetical protein